MADKQRALVEGINMVNKSAKPSAKNPQGGFVGIFFTYAAAAAIHGIYKNRQVRSVVICHRSHDPVGLNGVSQHMSAA